MPLAALINTAGNIYAANKAASSAKQANKLSALSQMYAQAWEKQKMQNAYQWTMQDMEKAGFNPILGVASNGINQGTGGGATVSGQQSQEGSILSQGIQSAVSAAQNQQSIANDKTRATSESARNIAESIKLLKEAGILGKYGEQKAVAEINNLNGQSAKANRDAKENYSNLGKISQDLSNGIKNFLKKPENASAKKAKTFGDWMKPTEY
nr:MAG TPA: minor capsid protein [Microviridae sp.]